MEFGGALNPSLNAHHHTCSNCRCLIAILNLLGAIGFDFPVFNEFARGVNHVVDAAEGFGELHDECAVLRQLPQGNLESGRQDSTLCNFYTPIAVWCNIQFFT
ncbi:hypothetical protein SCARR_04649 [Pontiella sulfatireligans]|uniref:Uncharacterized protein n=1 Tax=Pontiella sulfatireligans TaxID=2750658 RepID=A0A6C2UTK4_9BACT|nr:hypothetical protein SCARR_04649 [Pontiella sulfatireligans]